MKIEVFLCSLANQPSFRRTYFGVSFLGVQHPLRGGVWWGWKVGNVKGAEGGARDCCCHPRSFHRNGKYVLRPKS
jgi:hypothetical protein